MDLKEIAEIDRMHKERFSSVKELYKFLMEQMQSHMIEIDDLKNNKDPHYVKEIADLAILAKLLANCEGCDDSVFEERYKKFKEKIVENS